MKILIVDNTIDADCWGMPELVKQARQVSNAAVYVRRGPHGDLPHPNDFDRVIVSGSKASCNDSEPWALQLLNFIHQTLSAQKPFLGICYGHQMLARALGGIQMVRKRREPEFGWTEIEVIEDSPLFRGLPRKFHTLNLHYDEISALPPGMKNLARSKDCAVQAVQLRDLPVFGIQFHPERELEAADKDLAKYKKKGRPKHLIHYGEGKKYYDSKVGAQIFKNFLGTS